MLAHITFSISYVTVVVRAREAALHPEVEQAAMDLGASRIETVRLVVLPALWPAILAAGLLTFALSFDDFVLSFFTTGESPQPLPVRIWSAIRFGVTPTINAIGTLMLAISVLAIGLAIGLPRLLGRRESGLGVLLGREAAWARPSASTASRSASARRPPSRISTSRSRRASSSPCWGRRAAA